jgi:5-methylcytosine-specific restriction endonuclease McrA
MVSDAHRRAVHAAYRKNVVGTRKQYNLRAYRRAAKAVASSGAKCVKCGKPATTANHIRPLSKGGTMTGGLNAMCLKCASAQGGKAS